MIFCRFSLNFIDFNDLMGSAQVILNVLDTTTGAVLAPGRFAGAVVSLRYGSCFIGIVIIMTIFINFHWIALISMI